MVVVAVGRPVKWQDPEHVLRRLEQAPGRWHYRCAPVPVRQYAAAFLAALTTFIAASVAVASDIMDVTLELTGLL